MCVKTIVVQQNRGSQEPSKYVEPLITQTMMKKLLMMMVVALSMVLTANAQSKDDQRIGSQHKNRAEMVQKMTNRMVERYGLNDDQANQLLKLNETYQGKFMARRPGMGQRQLDKAQCDSCQHASKAQRPTKEQAEAMMKIMKEQREVYKAEVKKIMTAEQFAKYEEDCKNNRPGRKRAVR